MSDEMVEIDEFVAEESDYEILGFANDETTIYVNQLFGQCPDEMGAFLLVTHGEGSFSIYQAEAGCEFCGTDAFSNWRVSVDEPITRQKASDFVNQFEFTPLVVIPVGLMRRVCVDRTIADMIRDDFDGPNFPKARVGREIVKAVKLEMGWPLVEADDSLEADRQHRSRRIRSFWLARMHNEGWERETVSKQRSVPDSSVDGPAWVFDLFAKQDREPIWVTPRVGRDKRIVCRRGPISAIDFTDNSSVIVPSERDRWVTDNFMLSVTVKPDYAHWPGFDNFHVTYAMNEDRRWHDDEGDYNFEDNVPNTPWVGNDLSTGVIGALNSDKLMNSFLFENPLLTVRAEWVDEDARVYGGILGYLAKQSMLACKWTSRPAWNWLTSHKRRLIISFDIETGQKRSPYRPSDPW